MKVPRKAAKCQSGAGGGNFGPLGLGRRAGTIPDTGPGVLTRTVTETVTLTDDGLTGPAAESRFRIHAVTATGTILIEPSELPAC